MRDFDADITTPGIQPLNITVGIPDLALMKTAVPAQASLGDVVQFTVTLMHTLASRGEAFDAVVADTLPVGLTYVPGSAAPPAIVAGQQLTWTVAALTRLQGRTSFTYQARVDLTAVVGVPLTNTAVAGWTTQPGADANERTGADGAGGLNDLVTQTTAQVVPTESAFVDAAKTVTDLNGGSVLPGDTLEYTVVLRNQGGPVTGVVFTDPVPALTTYVPGSLSTTKGRVDDSRAPQLIVLVGDLAAGESVSISFRVTVAPGTASGSVISNQGSVDSDQTVPEPTDADGIDANGDQPTDVVVGGQPNGSLDGQKLVALLTDADTSGDVTAGDTLRYTVILAAGPTTLTNVFLNDTIPAGLTAVANSGTIVGGTGGTITLSGNAVSASLAMLAAGDIATLTFDATVDTPLANHDGNPDTETFTNQSMIGADGLPPGMTDADGDPSNGKQPTRITAVAEPGTGAPVLDDAKSVQLVTDLDGDTLVDPGDTLRWRMTVTNTGSAMATNVVLTDEVPAHTTLVPGSVVTSQGVVFGTNPIKVNIGTLPPGGVAVVSFNVIVNLDTPDQTIVANQGIVGGANIDPVPTDNDGDPTNGRQPTPVLVQTDADLSITKTASPNPAGVDGTLTYTLAVTNHGPDVAPDTMVMDTLPSSVVLLSATPSTGSCTGTTVITCALGDLPSGATTTIVITVRPTAAGSLHNEAMATSGRPDPTPDDNHAAVDVTVEVLTDLAVTKTASSQTAIVGDQVVFTIVATNHGPSAATNVVVSDPLPPGLTFVSATTDHGSCADAGGTITCNLGNLPAGASATITLDTTRTSTDAIANTATLTGGEKDPDGSNNTSTSSLLPSRGEDCGNCVDDDGNGQIDSEDSACCTAEPLTVTQARYRPGRSTLRVTATMPDGTFSGVDPRKDTIRLQVRTAQGETVCCALPPDQWQHLFRKSYGFFDQKMTVCPGIRCVKLTLPKKGQPRATIIAGRVKPGGPMLTPLQITISADNQCAAGPLTLQPKAHGAVGFP